MIGIYLRLALAERDEPLLLELSDLQAVQGNGAGCILRMKNRQTYLVKDSIQSIEERLQQVFRRAGTLTFARNFDSEKPHGVFEASFDPIGRALDMEPPLDPPSSRSGEQR